MPPETDLCMNPPYPCFLHPAEINLLKCLGLFKLSESLVWYCRAPGADLWARTLHTSIRFFHTAGIHQPPQSLSSRCVLRGCCHARTEILQACDRVPPSTEYALETLLLLSLFLKLGPCCLNNLKFVSHPSISTPTPSGSAHCCMTQQ